MPDPFFASTKTRKRKRSTSAQDAPARSGRNARAGAKNPKEKAQQQKKARRDEELSDKTDDDGEDIDDMDLRADDDEEISGDEYENETPAEKRLRLAKLYLETVKHSLGAYLPAFLLSCTHSGPADGEFDAADVDREIIASRLKQDVLEHSGKVHLFIADSVRTISCI